MAAATPAVPAPGLSAPAAASTSDRAKDVWGYSVIVAVAFFVAGPIVLGGSTPDTTDGAAKIQSYYADHATRQILAAVGMALSGVGFAVFASTLLRSLRRVAGTDASWPWLAFAGGLIVSFSMLLGAGMHAMFSNDAKHLSPAAAAALNTADGAPFVALIGGLGLLALGAIAATWRARALPRWFSILGIVLAIGTMTPIGWIIGLGTFLWLIALGVMMATRGLSARQPA